MKFNKKVFFITTIIIGILTFLSFWAAFFEDEGTLPENLFCIILAQLFYIFRFPTHTLFWSIIINAGVTVYFIGLFINSLLYGFLTERIISCIKFIMYNFLTPLSKKIIHNFFYSHV